MTVPKVGFTGSRTGTTKEQRQTLRQLVSQCPFAEFHHGDCVGADQDFHCILREFTSNFEERAVVGMAYVHTAQPVSPSWLRDMADSLRADPALDEWPQYSAVFNVLDVGGTYRRAADEIERLLIMLKAEQQRFATLRSAVGKYLTERWEWQKVDGETYCTVCDGDFPNHDGNCAFVHLRDAQVRGRDVTT